MTPKAFHYRTTAQVGSSWESKSLCSILMRISCCILLVLSWAPGLSEAQEFIWQNDALGNGQDGIVQAGFTNGDIGAAVFDLPCACFPLEIKAVQAYWRSQAEPTTQVMVHFRVYGAGGPDLGAPLYTGEGAVMTAGYLNEFSTAGLGWVIDQGPFAVGVEYLGTLGQAVDQFSGHLTTDADGCQDAKNFVYDGAAGQWLEACTLGVSGDFVIRILIESTPQGCFGDADCDGDVDLREFATLQVCFTGEGAAASQECQQFDCDGDGDVDSADFSAFSACLSGPGNACDIGCVACQSATWEDTRYSGSQTPLQTIVPAVFLDGIQVPVPGDLSHGREARAGGPRWTLTQVSITVGIIAIIGVVFIGPCWTATCRNTLKSSFFLDGAQATSQEQNRINQALDWLGNSGDQEAGFAWTWYSTHGAYNAFLRIIKVNHWADRQGMIAAEGLAKVVVHEEFITGDAWEVEALALILFAEWQHIDRPGATEQQLELELQALRQRLGVTDVLPTMQHGFGEGAGVD